MFRCLNKRGSILPHTFVRNVRSFSSNIDAWLSQAVPAPRGEACAIKPSQLDKLVNLLKIPAVENSWSYNDASGAHPAFFYTIGGEQQELLSTPPEPYTSRIRCGGSIVFEKPLFVCNAVNRGYAVVGEPVLKHGKSGDFLAYSQQTQYAFYPDARTGIYAFETTAYVVRDKANKLPMKPVGESTQGQDPFDWETDVVPLTEEMIAEYSELTANTNKVHLDKAHAQEEGFDDIVVQVPLEVTLLLDFCGTISKDLAGEEHSLSKKMREEMQKLLDEPAEEKGHHHHHHNGQACDGNHGPQKVPDVLWHPRFQKLVHLEYNPCQPLLANTPVRIYARKIIDNHVPEENPTTYRQVLRNGQARVLLWIQDARDTDIKYMVAIATFDEHDEVYYAGVQEDQLDALLL